MIKKRAGKRTWFFAALIGMLFALLVLVGVGVALAPSYWLRGKLEEAGSSCHLCRLQVGSLGWQLAPLGLRADDIQFRSGDKRDSAVFVTAKSVSVPLPLFSLLHAGPWRIGVIELRGLEVTVHEGGAHLPDPPASEPSSSRGVWIEGLQARGATFTYRNDSPGGQAVLRLDSISVVAGGFGTNPADQQRPLLARAEARLEQSGAVTLAVSANYFSRPAFADVDLHVDGQRLSEVNEYFLPEEGVELSGELKHAHGLVKVRGTKAEGQVSARFAGLALKFRANRHRGGLAAFLDNLGAGLMLKGGNLKDPRAEAVGHAETLRKPKQSAVSFVLRTLLEAVMKVAKK